MESAVQESPNKRKCDGEAGHVKRRKEKRTPKNRKSQFHSRSSFRGIPFNRQFVTAVYLLFQFFLLEKTSGRPLKSFAKAR